MNIIRALRLAMSYPNELEGMLQEERKKREQEVRDAQKDRLDLCYRHQPDSPGSHFAEHNCDYCKLEKKNG